MDSDLKWLILIKDIERQLRRLEQLAIQIMTPTPKKRLKLKKKLHPLTSLSRERQSEIQDDITSAHWLYNQALKRRAVFKTNDVELSEDLTQTTFLKTLLYLRKGGRIDTMRAFLNHILNDLIVDEYRKRKSISLDTLLENGFEPGVDDTVSLINKLDGKEATHLINKLPKKYRAVIRMRFVQQLSLKEISILTDQKQNTVSVQSYRGLKKLQALESNGHK